MKKFDLEKVFMYSFIAAIIFLTMIGMANADSVLVNESFENQNNINWTNGLTIGANYNHSSLYGAEWSGAGYNNRGSLFNNSFGLSQYPNVTSLFYSYWVYSKGGADISVGLTNSSYIGNGDINNWLVWSVSNKRLDKRLAGTWSYTLLSNASCAAPAQDKWYFFTWNMTRQGGNDYIILDEYNSSMSLICDIQGNVTSGFTGLNGTLRPVLTNYNGGSVQYYYDDVVVKDVVLAEEEVFSLNASEILSIDGEACGGIFTLGDVLNISFADVNSSLDDFSYIILDSETQGFVCAPPINDSLNIFSCNWDTTGYNTTGQLSLYTYYNETLMNFSNDCDYTLNEPVTYSFLYPNDNITLNYIKSYNPYDYCTENTTYNNTYFEWNIDIPNYIHSNLVCCSEYGCYNCGSTALNNTLVADNLFWYNLYNNISVIYYVELLNSDYNVIYQINSSNIINMTTIDNGCIEACMENWQYDSNECIINETLISYTDYNNCGTYMFLPVDNGTMGECTIEDCVESWSGTNSVCLNNLTMLTYNDLNTCGTFNDVPFLNGTSSICGEFINLSFSTEIILIFVIIIIIFIIGVFWIPFALLIDALFIVIALILILNAFVLDEMMTFFVIGGLGFIAVFCIIIGWIKIQSSRF